MANELQSEKNVGGFHAGREKQHPQHGEQQNHTLRMHCRRLTRLTKMFNNNYSSPPATINPPRASMSKTRAFFFSNPPNIKRLAVGGLEKKNATYAGDPIVVDGDF